MAPQTNNTRCYFLELPAELRVQIYEMLYSEDHYVTVLVADGMRYHDRATSKSFSLLLTCKAINKEAFSTFIDSAKLQICISDYRANPRAPKSRLGRPDDSSLLKRAKKVHLRRFHTGDYDRSAYLGRIAQVLKGLDHFKNVKELWIDLPSLFPNSVTDGPKVFSLLCGIQCSGKVVYYGTQLSQEDEMALDWEFDGIESPLKQPGGMYRDFAPAVSGPWGKELLELEPVPSDPSDQEELSLSLPRLRLSDQEDNRGGRGDV